MNFNISFKSLNDTIEKLSYARVYQSPMQNENEFNIEVKHENGGSYEMLKNLIELAKKEGYKYKKYYEMSDPWGSYHYTAMMYVDEGQVRCYYNQKGVYIVGDD